MAMMDFVRDYKAKQEVESAAGRAGELARAYSTEAIDFINKYYGEAEEAYQPWIKSGIGAQKIMDDLMGINGPEAQTKAMESYKSDPSYRIAVDQANTALERSALAKGDIFSGNFAAESGKLNADLASQGYGNYYQRLMGMSGAGLGASGALAGLKTGRGTNLANIKTGLGATLGGLELTKGSASARMYENWKADEENTSNKVMNIIGMIYGMKGGGGKMGGKGGGGGGDYVQGSQTPYYEGTPNYGGSSIYSGELNW